MTVRGSTDLVDTFFYSAASRPVGSGVCIPNSDCRTGAADNPPIVRSSARRSGVEKFVGERADLVGTSSELDRSAETRRSLCVQRFDNASNRL